jgi:hypothetical protein
LKIIPYDFSISLLAVSLSFDIKLPNGQSTRHPNVDRFIDSIGERLNQAIQIYEKTPLGKLILTYSNYK